MPTFVVREAISEWALLDLVLEEILLVEEEDDRGFQEPFVVENGIEETQRLIHTILSTEGERSHYRPIHSSPFFLILTLSLSLSSSQPSLPLIHLLSSQGHMPTEPQRTKWPSRPRSNESTSFSHSSGHQHRRSCSKEFLSYQRAMHWLTKLCKRCACYACLCTGKLMVPIRRICAENNYTCRHIIPVTTALDCTTLVSKVIITSTSLS